MERMLRRARLRMFGHVPRLPVDAPAQVAMDFDFGKIGKRRRGKPQTTLPNRIDGDLRAAELKVKTHDDLLSLRNIAADRLEWPDVMRRCDA